MKRILIISAAILAVVIAFSGCSSKAKSEAETTSDTGLTVDQIMADAPSLVGDTVTVEAPCSHLCSQGGKKAFLVGSADTLLLRCEAYPLMGKPFPKECIHRVLKVRGILREQRIDEAAIAQMEAAYKSRIETEQGHGSENGFTPSATDSVPTRRQSGCDTERTAQGQRNLTTFEERMADYRARIAARQNTDGKPYLSFYYLDALSYTIAE